VVVACGNLPHNASPGPWKWPNSSTVDAIDSQSKVPISGILIPTAVEAWNKMKDDQSMGAVKRSNEEE
jgi:hypothetical protein